MKSKVMFYCLLAFTVVTLSGCKKNNEDFVEKYVGSYKISIKPNFNLTYSGYGPYNLTSDSNIETNCTITNNDNNVVVKIEGVNGIIDDITITGYCDGFSMRLDDSSYDGYIRFSANDNVDCDIILDNPSVSTPYNGRLSWDSSVSGTCKADIFGLGSDTQCDVIGKISFVADKK